MVLQGSGPKEEDVATILEIEQRAFENGQQVRRRAGCSQFFVQLECTQFFVNACFMLQENSYWLDHLIRAYQSRIYTGNLKESFQVEQDEEISSQPITSRKCYIYVCVCICVVG